MTRKIAQLSFILLVLFVGSALTQPTQSIEVQSFAEVKSKTEEPTQFEFTFGGSRFTISESGRGQRSTSDSRSTNFSLRLENDEVLERAIYFAKFQNDILFIAETYLADGGAGFLARLDGRTLRMKWKRHIPAFNVGPGLIGGKYAYVTAIGFLGKVDLRNGAYIWKHDNLYDQESSAFNSFELPDISGSKIVFTEAEHYLRKTRASLEVNIRTGSILRRINAQ